MSQSQRANETQDTIAPMDDLERHLSTRRLVDSFYDIQDVRMRTENRLRQMPRQSELYARSLREIEKGLSKEIASSIEGEEIYQQFLSRIHGIGPLISGWIIARTMIRFDEVSAKDFKAAVDQLDAPEEAAGELNTKEFMRLTRSQVRLAQKTGKGNYRIPNIRGIGKFATISALWAWWGLHVTDEGRSQRRRRGETIDFDANLRMFTWRIGRTFKMHGKDRKTGASFFYRRIYDRYKMRLFDNPRPVKVNGVLVSCPAFKHIIEDPKRCPYYTDQYCSKGPCKGHLDSMAIRYTVKIFLGHLWLQWRTLEGLPVRDPYAIEKLGHTTLIPWEPDRE